MTIAIGMAAKDGAVLVADRLGVIWSSTAKDEDVQKAYPIGCNCAIGLAGKGNVSKNILAECGFINSTEHRDVRHFARQVANSFRRAELGKTLDPRWWEVEELTSQESQKVWSGSQIPAVIAGYDDGPVVLSLEPTTGFSVHDEIPAHAIGMCELANWLLERIYPKGAEKTESMESAAFFGVLCAYVAHCHSSLVGGVFDVLNITEGEVRYLDCESVARLTSEAAVMVAGWFRQARLRSSS